MKRVSIDKIKLFFECEEHLKTQTITPIDLVLCGTPLCEICNEEMAMEDFAEVDI